MTPNSLGEILQGALMIIPGCELTEFRVSLPPAISRADSAGSPAPIAGELQECVNYARFRSLKVGDKCFASQLFECHASASFAFSASCSLNRPR